MRAQLAALGTVRYIVAPNKMHHLFVAECAAAFPAAQLFGAPGLGHKRKDLQHMRELSQTVEPAWAADLEQIFFAGIPPGNESVWFHKASRTLIVTDLCQWWQANLPFAARVYASLAGVRTQLAVPRTIRLRVRDQQAAQASAQRILAWPFTRVIVAHNAIIDENAHPAVEKACAVFTRE